MTYITRWLDTCDSTTWGVLLTLTIVVLYTLWRIRRH